MEFDWDADNLQHIARHGINPKEAEEAVLIEPLEAIFNRTKAKSGCSVLGAPNQGDC